MQVRDTSRLPRALRHAITAHERQLVALLEGELSPPGSWCPGCADMMTPLVETTAPADEFADLRKRLALGDLCGFGWLWLAEGVAVSKPADYCREQLAELTDPETATPAG